MQSYEYVLCHHGVKGMKWGVRKQRQSSRITVRQAYKNAKESEREARRESLARDKADGATIRRAANNMNKAGREAMYESIRRDKEYNQQLRGQQQSQSWMQRNGKKLAIAAAGTAVALSGAALVAKYMKSKGMSSSGTFGNIYQRTAGFRGINRGLIRN